MFLNASEFWAEWLAQIQRNVPTQDSFQGWFLMKELWLYTHMCLHRSVSLTYSCHFLLLEILIIYLKVLHPDIVISFFSLFCQNIDIMSLQLLRFDKLLHVVFNKYYLEDIFWLVGHFVYSVLLAHQVYNVPITIFLIKGLGKREETWILIIHFMFWKEDTKSVTPSVRWL